MSASRRSSSSSLSRHYNRGNPGDENDSRRTMDFCNNFWGAQDAGVDVLFARMRGAMRTMNELGAFWKERAAIEEDYGKRLAKLSKTALGKDEVGELRSCLDTILQETEKQSTHHLTMHQQIKGDIENQVNVFCAKQAHHKKNYQAVIEKQFKQKQKQEAYVTEAREKYEQDCMRINSYTAQSSLVQGRDLDKITLKLEKAQMTVQQNERDFANFARAFQDTAAKWETDWKTFCDTCQDIEEDRMEFMRDNMWAFANAVSTVCVSDDESCERVRVSLEQVDSEKEMENFVRDFGTGNQIQAPPQFVNFNKADAQTSMHPTFRPANFLRSSQRSSQAPSPMPPSSNLPSESEDEPFVNNAGRGAGSRNSQSSAGPSLTRQPSRGAVAQPAANGVNGQSGHSPSASTSSSARGGVSPQPQFGQPTQQVNLSRKPTHRVSVPPTDPLADPIDPTADTYIKVGQNAYRVDPSRDPQQQSIQRPGTAASQHSTFASASPSKANGANPIDPLARQLEELQNTVATTGSVRRQSVRKSMGATSSGSSSAAASNAARRATMDLAAPGGSSFPGTSPSPSRDYRNSADLVIGAPPSTSRSVSPNAGPSGGPAPTAAFMVPRKPSPSPGADVEGVLADYHQSLPGERKSVSLSRNGSRRGSYVGPPPDSQHRSSNSLSQPQPFGAGHAGVGAHASRSPSPQPLRRSPSPNPGEVMQHHPTHQHHQSSGSIGGVASRPQSRPQSQHGMQPPQQSIQRSPSPNTVGIALDPHGRVAHDDMAQRYQQQQQQQQQQQRPPQQQQQPIQQYRPATTVQQFNVPPPPPISAPPVQNYNQQQRQSTLGYQQPQQTGYGGASPAPYHQPQQSYSQPPQSYSTPAQQQYAQPPQQQPVYQQQTGYARAQSAAGGHYGQQQQQQYTGYGQPQQQGLHSQQQSYASYNRSPSPAPGMGQQTEEGRPILCYVQALYDYEATIDEEFSFQAGDIIAVTATPEDGWWSGQLLDENRRQPGRHVFPSNFARLF